MRRAGPMKRSRLRRQSAKRQKEAVALAELRLYVLERDQYMCRYCRARNRLLEVDHIEKRSQRPDLLLEPLNCITLCWPCHNWKDNGDPHSKMGRLKVERFGQTVHFWIDYQGKLARSAGVFSPQTTSHVVIPNNAQESTA